MSFELPGISPRMANDRYDKIFPQMNTVPVVIWWVMCKERDYRVFEERSIL